MSVSYQGTPTGFDLAMLETLPVPGFPEGTAGAGSFRRVDELGEMELIDDLTGLGNRRFAEIEITGRLAECRRQGELSCLLHVDVDRLDSINDRYGHDEGDQVLRTVGETLRSAVKASDFVGRWGGGEFVLVLARADRIPLLRTAERLRGLVSTSMAHASRGPRVVTVSIGAATSRPDDLPGTLAARAEALTRAAKKGGGNRVVVEDPLATLRK